VEDEITYWDHGMGVFKKMGLKRPGYSHSLKSEYWRAKGQEFPSQVIDS
jgi:hypothetical protein